MQVLNVVNETNRGLLEEFISIAGNSLETFRYFNKRPLEVINNHVITYIITIDGIPAAYGHLDCENDIIWLGIAVAEKYNKQGLGNTMMQYLINHAKEKKISEISLAVDKENRRAENLYKKFGFKVDEVRPAYLIYKLIVS